MQWIEKWQNQLSSTKASAGLCTWDRAALDVGTAWGQGACSHPMECQYKHSSTTCRSLCCVLIFSMGFFSPFQCHERHKGKISRALFRVEVYPMQEILLAVANLTKRWYCVYTQSLQGSDDGINTSLHLTTPIQRFKTHTYPEKVHLRTLIM